MSIPLCDHSSVGVLIWHDERLLMIERKRRPFGFAPPAGHVDDHGTFEDAARQEVLEEVGLEAETLELITEGYRDNECRRPRGTWHYWKIYRAVCSGEVATSEDEVVSHRWCTVDELNDMARKTLEHIKRASTDSDIRDDPGLEEIWLYWLAETGVLDAAQLPDRPMTSR